MLEDKYFYAREPLPEWAERLSEGQMRIMGQAYTRNGERHGNAVIIEIYLNKRKEPRFTLVTESGNIIQNMSHEEFDEAFMVGKFILKKFPTMESKLAWHNYWDSKNAETFS